MSVQTTQANLQAALDDGYAVGHRGDIILTSSLLVRTSDTIFQCQNTRFIWDGPAGHAAIFVERPFSYIGGFQVLPGATDPGACIALWNENAPKHSTSSVIERVRLGLYNQRRITAGIRIGGQVNGDSMEFRKVWVSGAKEAAFDVPNPQALNCEFNGVWAGFNERMLWLRGSDAGGKYGPGKCLMRGVNAHYSTTADFDLGPFSSVNVTGFNGEHSKRLALIGSGSGMAIKHGYWQRGVEAVSAAEGFVRGPGNGIDSWFAPEELDCTSVVAGSAPERVVGVWRVDWDNSPANRSRVRGIDPGPRPHPTLVVNRCPWWDRNANKWVFADHGSGLWRDAVGNVVA